MKYLFSTLFLITVVFFSKSQDHNHKEFTCNLLDSITDESSDSKDRLLLDSTLKDIKKVASSEVCYKAKKWEILPVGFCNNSPTGYIVVKKDPENVIQNRILCYTEMEKKYHSKLDGIPICTCLIPPNRVKCEDDKAVMFYK